MNSNIGAKLGDCFKSLADTLGSTLSESIQYIRVDNIVAPTVDIVGVLKSTASLVGEYNLGEFEVFGDVSGRIATPQLTLDDVYGERLTVILNKPPLDERCFFITQDGFRGWLETLTLEAQGSKNRRIIEVVDDLSEFSTFMFTVKPFGSVRALSEIKQPAEKPGKLIRDFTQRFTPQYIDSWLICDRPRTVTKTFYTWANVAKKKLIYCLPAEIRNDGDGDHVFFRGGRSLPIPIEENVDWDSVEFEKISEICEWIYLTPRESETKFQLLNNHIGINWVAGSAWPSGVNDILNNSFSGAREAFAFHLQEQSKEALKSLGDLRKGLQEEVSKTQVAARELVSALWRDFAVAGVVAALKAPMFKAEINDGSMRALQLGVAALLFVSLLVSSYSNIKFNFLADASREEWRKKLYSFMSAEDWSRLVVDPINSGRRTYWLSWLLCLFLYISMIRYFLGLALPEFVSNYIDFPVILFLDFVKAVMAASC